MLSRARGKTLLCKGNDESMEGDELKDFLENVPPGKEVAIEHLGDDRGVGLPMKTLDLQLHCM